MAPMGFERATARDARTLTAIAAHLFPHWTRHDLTPPHDPPDLLGKTVTGFDTAGAEIDMPIELSEITPDAAFVADLRDCSVETGARQVEALSELGARFLRHYGEQTA